MLSNRGTIKEKSINIFLQASLKTLLEEDHAELKSNTAIIPIYIETLIKRLQSLSTKTRFEVIGTVLHIRKERKKIKKFHMFILLSTDKNLRNLIIGNPMLAAPVIL